MTRETSRQASRRPISAAALAALGAATVTCSSLAPATDTWNSAEGRLDTPEGGSADAGAEWACLADPLHLTAPDASPSKVTYVAAIVDFYSQPTLLAAIPGLTVDVCSSPACDAPITDRVLVSHPMAPFVWAFEMPSSGLNVFLRTRAAGYVDFNYVLGGPLIGTPYGNTTINGLVIPPITEIALDNLYVQVGAERPRNRAKGILAVRTLNCYLNPDGSPDQNKSRGEGVQVKVIDAQTNAPPAAPAVGWTLSFNNLARPAIDNVLQKTDNRGVAGYFELNPGNYDVQAIAPDGSIYAHTLLQVSANVVTLAELRRGLEVWGE